jgi:predicted transposase YdaD
VEREAVDYYRTIKHSELSADCKAALLDVLVSWLGQRFKHKGIQETLAMLLGELPPLEETQLGKELIQIGEQRGQEKGLAQGLQKGLEKGRLEGLRLALKLKFGEAGLDLMPEIAKIEDPAALEKLFQAIETAATPEHLRPIWAAPK